MILPAQAIRKLCYPSTELEICNQCDGTGWGHPDDFSGKCAKCDGTGSILRDAITVFKPLIHPFKEKHQIHGLSRGLSECGYDISIDQDLTLYPVSIRYLLLNAVHIRRPSFALASSYEQFNVPDHLCFRVVDKSTWIRRGLTVHNTVAEPGWSGYLTLELCNQGGEVIQLLKGMPIAQVIFQQLSEPTEIPYAGKYHHQSSGPQPAIMDI